MIQIVAWAGAGLALIAGVGMLFARVDEAARARTRTMGFVFLGLAAFNVFMATVLV